MLFLTPENDFAGKEQVIYTPLLAHNFSRFEINLM